MDLVTGRNGVDLFRVFHEAVCDSIRSTDPADRTAAI